MLKKLCSKLFSGDDLTNVLQNFSAPLFYMKPDGGISAINDQAKILAKDIPARLPTGIASHINSKLKKDKGTSPLREWLTPSGRVFDIAGISKGKKPIIAIFDAGDRQRLAESLRQGAKMQAIGRLAGGLAHDFNNLLTAMIGYCDLLSERHSESDPSFDQIKNIRQNAIRASNLVKQLLAFSREQVLRPQILDLPNVIAEVWSLLARLAGVTIRLESNVDTNLKGIEADPVQIEQILINLTINARDAMHFGGRIKISGRNFLVKKAIPCRGELVEPGQYVELVVEDSGSGLDSKIIDRIFDPFFTTKELGKGTGLGLAVIDGIMRQSGGYVFANNSKSGLSGASFTLLFPAVEKSPNKVKNTKAKEMSDLTGEAKIMLVEDESAVRVFLARALRSKGYEVIEAQSGDAALAIAKDTVFDALVTDLIMPGISGTELLVELRKKSPDLPCLCMSGYAEAEIRNQLQEVTKIEFIAKPFRLKEILESVKNMLEAKDSVNGKNAVKNAVKSAVKSAGKSAKKIKK